MSIHALPARFLSPGETSMPHAPVVELDNGEQCIPQHYLRYRHMLASISQLAGQVEFDAHTLLFAGEDHGGMYVQAGLIGRENYDRSNALRARKLVYGRKWRIDADTPTSEIIQTLYLAIKKAREHEVRELLTLRAADGKTSAVFSHHHDLPLLARQRERLHVQPAAVSDPVDALRGQLAALRFAQRPIELVQAELRANGQWLIDLRLGEPPLARKQEGDFAEYDGLALTLLLPEGRLHELPYALMDALVAHSDRHVDEHFRFQGFARFSRNNAVQAIAALSLQTRPYARDMADARFERVFRASNYEVDASRAPVLGEGELGRKNRQLLDTQTGLLGHMPRGYRAEALRDKTA
ncbi:hypothetical protein [Chitinilyticum piscinae]|uniref:Uncharacterized protein n=1 Tax=Chitinilyticum piscinae TaxID=2866724 RepID=A0A8J7G186_9NEIS|nr:hypothetical protein [Chitinilyticum piscinae]MBE9609533.1 hypothetical protein [Chitinilyticum piscinae]